MYPSDISPTATHKTKGKFTMKKIISLIVALAVVIGAIPAMAEETPIKVVLDGNYIQFDVEPQMIDDRTMVPVRAIFTALGANVDWDELTNTVTSSKGDINISLTIDDKTLYKNGEAIELDVPAKLVDDRTLVPVRAISEAYGCQVDWNNGLNTVVIISDLSNVEITKINDESVSAGYFNYCMYNVEINIANQLGTTLEDLEKMWNSSLGEVTFGKYITETCVENISLIKSVKAVAQSEGITLDDTDVNDVETAVSNFRSNYASDREYADVLESLGTTEKDLKDYLSDVAIFNKVYVKYQKDLGMSDDQVKKYLDDNYIQAQHVLISTQGLDDNEKAQKAELAEKVYEFARQGMDFEKLVAEYGEDPGMKANPEGYLFTKGEMVEKFENIAFGLKVGQISGVVETEYGYHIIKRVKNIYTDEILEQAKAMLVEDSITDKFKSLSKNATVTNNEGLISVITLVGI